MSLLVDIEKRLGAFRLRVRFEAGAETLALLGASGCGKSMTLKCIAGIERPDAGRICLDGRTLFDRDKHIDLPPQKRRVGYLFQQYALFPNMSVSQNVAAGARARRGGRELVEKALQAVDLTACAHLRPAQLSGGQQQRAALARILVSGPDVLMLDEPFSALDSHLRWRMEREVSKAIRDFGKSVLLVSHDRDEVFRLADRVAVLHQGQIEAIGPKHDVFRAPVTRAGAVLTGCKNISPLRALGPRRALALDWGLELELDRDVGDAACLGIRMHGITPRGERNRFRFQVVELIENPFSYTVMVRPVDRPCAAPVGWETEKGTWRALAGEQVELCLPPEEILLLKES